MIKNGYFPHFKLFGIPVLIHWSYPIGALIVASLLGDFKLARILPAIYSYTLLIVIHELGHAFFAKVAKSKILKITLDGMGGWCYIDEPRGFWELLLFYTGGLIAQLLLLLVTLAVISVLGKPSTEGLQVVVYMFTFFNIVLIIGNLIPYSENDGKKIYELVRSKNKI